MNQMDASKPFDLGAAPLVQRVEIHCLRYPLSQPLRTVMGTLHSRPAVLLRIEDNEGAFGWGEIWCNFPPNGAEHRAELAAHVLPSALNRLDLSRPFETFQRLRTQLRPIALQAGEGGPVDQIASGLDIAVHDLLARRAGLPLASYLGGAPVRLKAYASGIDCREVDRLIPEARALGFDAFKLRVGFSPEIDQRALTNIAEWRQPGEWVAIDANQSWTIERIQQLAPAFETAALGWVEEPLPVDDPTQAWQAARRVIPSPISGGENMRSMQEFESAAEGDIFDVIQPDICKWGGFSETLRIARMVEAKGKIYCPHFLGSGLGLVGSAHLLAAVGGRGRLEIDVNENGLRDLIAADSLVVTKGTIETPDAFGLGITPSEDVLATFGALHHEVRPATRPGSGQ